MKSKDRLLEFLEEVYMEEGGAGDIGTAIRDCITDLTHINNNIPLQDFLPMETRLESAFEVVAEEEEQEKSDLEAIDHQDHKRGLYGDVI